MDTLIDNRQFPPEMQQVQNFNNKKSTPWLLILLILIALGIILFLVYTIFFKKDMNKTVNGRTYEQKKELISDFSRSVPVMTSEERQNRVNTFFGK